MENALIITTFVAGIAVLIYFINKKLSELQKPSDGMSLIMQNLADIRRDLESSQGKTAQKFRIELIN